MALAWRADREWPDGMVEKNSPWFHGTVSNPKTPLAIALTRLSTSPKGGRQYRGILPPLRSDIICIVHPSSLITSSLDRDVTEVRENSWVGRYISGPKPQLTVGVRPCVHGYVASVPGNLLHTGRTEVSHWISIRYGRRITAYTTPTHLPRILPPIMKCVAAVVALFCFRKSFNFELAGPGPSSNVT
jgi:hypothetical protein